MSFLHSLDSLDTAPSGGGALEGNTAVGDTDEKPYRAIRFGGFANWRSFLAKDANHASGTLIRGVQLRAERSPHAAR
jgi:hypothetical protein